MKVSTAIDAAQSYATLWGVPWLSVRSTKRHRSWLYLFRTVCFELEIDTGVGTAQAFVHVGRRDAPIVGCFDYSPKDGSQFMLPLWAAYPWYNAFTMNWRQAGGEEYRIRWLIQWERFSIERKDEYCRRFPEPDDERGWQGWYERLEEANRRHKDG